MIVRSHSERALRQHILELGNMDIVPQLKIYGQWRLVSSVQGNVIWPFGSREWDASD